MGDPQLILHFTYFIVYLCYSMAICKTVWEILSLTTSRVFRACFYANVLCEHPRRMVGSEIHLVTIFICMCVCVQNLKWLKFNARCEEQYIVLHFKKLVSFVLTSYYISYQVTIQRSNTWPHSRTFLLFHTKNLSVYMQRWLMLSLLKCFVMA